MSVKVTVNAHLSQKLMRKLQYQITDDKTMYAIHDVFAIYCDPYVPMYTGMLSTFGRATPEGVMYLIEYAHYMYMGEVYGPNIPVFDKDGELVRFWSPPGQKKHTTGRKIKYSHEVHSKATDHWDKAMMRDKGKDFERQVELILNKRAAEVTSR